MQKVSERAAKAVAKCVKTIYNLCKDCVKAYESRREVLHLESLRSRGVGYRWKNLLNMFCKKKFRVT
jgi:hypothetical protein